MYAGQGCNYFLQSKGVHRRPLFLIYFTFRQTKRRPYGLLRMSKKWLSATFSSFLIRCLRLWRGQHRMQGKPCYARAFADLPRMSPNPNKAIRGCGPLSTPGFFGRLKEGLTAFFKFTELLVFLYGCLCRYSLTAPIKAFKRVNSS